MTSEHEPSQDDIPFQPDWMKQGKQCFQVELVVGKLEPKLLGHVVADDIEDVYQRITEHWGDEIARRSKHKKGKLTVVVKRYPQDCDGPPPLGETNDNPEETERFGYLW